MTEETEKTYRKTPTFVKITLSLHVAIIIIISHTSKKLQLGRRTSAHRNKMTEKSKNTQT